ncbi:HD-GYP domain-containing protein [Comamonas flocculans]|uniref:HD-GYP domain-containing protein n=1 Tax=Comamonas flocculans TaxID=2597701 RepID=A0A5B8RWN5_9BURK|nr:HD-GYP domain-containing protein [Comamonas flocculans]QEA13124.1 HD-GYP domain-containing protein [Comamonas flocculans]
MLKRISVDDLALGMFVHEFCGSWMDHPFWRSRFLLDSARDLERIRATPIREVMIDIARGKDVQRAPANTAGSAPATVPEPPPEPGTAQRSPTGTRDEMRRAALICNKARQAVVSMFSEVRLGKAPDTVVASGLVQEISDSVMRNPGALISLARLKTADDYTYMHSVAVCALMVALGRQLGLDEAQLRTAGMAGLLHDLGKAMMDQSVLNKPGRLTDAEFEHIKTHPHEGWKLLHEAGSVDAAVLDVVRHHHERMDGRGYPDGLSGERFSLLARMGAICDVYDAITSNRPYKRGWDPAESIRRMAEWTKGHLDPVVFQAFVKSLGIYPTGSLVRLNSGRLAVVLEQSRETLVAPVVKAFYSTKSEMRIAPEVIHLAAPGCRDGIAGREEPSKWNFPDLDELWTEAAVSA